MALRYLANNILNIVTCTHHCGALIVNSVEYEIQEGAIFRQRYLELFLEIN
jgi:hypothetical protein